MKKIFLLVLLFGYQLSSYSQIDSTKVAFVSYWSIGDSYNFKISKIKQQWKKDSLTKDQKQVYIAKFTVIDSTKNSYTINWSYENDLKNNYKIPDEFLYKFSKYKLTEIKYKTSEVGEFIEVLNWKEVSNIMNEMMTDIFNNLDKYDAKTMNKIEKALKPIKQIYSSKRGIEQLVVKELQYLHYPMGIEYDITEPILYTDEIPNMFGGAPIKGKAKLYFEDVDFENGFCVLKQETTMDPEGAKKLLFQLFRKMRLNDAKIKEAFKTAVFDIKDRSTFEYYYNPGIPHKIETTRETIIDIDQEKGKRIDKTIIELIYNE